MQVISDLVVKIKIYINGLTIREKNLLAILGAAFTLVLMGFIYSTATQLVKEKNRVATNSKEQIALLEESLLRYRSLKSRKEELTTKYLNSSMSYEQLTSHLDNVLKEQIKDSTYELAPSRDTIEIGTEFIAKKFSLSINKLEFPSLTKLLLALENGPPPLLIQRVDTVRLSKEGSLKLSLDLLTVEKIQSK